MRPIKRTELIERVIDDEIVILDRRNDQVHQLNPLAGYIWRKLDGKRRVDEIVNDVGNEFDVDPAVASKDVANYIEQLKQLDLVQIEPPVAQEEIENVKT